MSGLEKVTDQRVSHQSLANMAELAERDNAFRLFRAERPLTPGRRSPARPLPPPSHPRMNPGLTFGLLAT